MDFKTKDVYDINDLRLITKILRSEEGCPWDRVQTHQSIRRDFIEETYEAVEAIDKNDSALLREELGDVLFQVLFHSEIEEEEGRFNFDDVVSDICKKLVIRHPHVFGETKVENTEEVLTNWEAIKNAVKGTASYTETLHNVPAVFPALMRGQKISKRAAKAGMRYPDIETVLSDLDSEIRELREAIKNQEEANISEELGDVLFCCANLAHELDVDAEQSLSVSCDKFIDRFSKVEALAAAEGKNMADMDIDSLNELWRKAKRS